MSNIIVSTNLERIMGRAMLDEAFRTQLFTDLEVAVRETGLSLSDAEMAQIESAVNKIKLDQLNHQLENQPLASERGWD